MCSKLPQKDWLIVVVSLFFDCHGRVGGLSSVVSWWILWLAIMTPARESSSGTKCGFYARSFLLQPACTMVPTLVPFLPSTTSTNSSYGTKYGTMVPNYVEPSTYSTSFRFVICVTTKMRVKRARNREHEIWRTRTKLQEQEGRIKNKREIRWRFNLGKWAK